MSNTITACVVGLGRAGRIHAESMQALPQFQLKYVVDTDEQVAKEMGQKYNATALQNINEALQDDTLDAVVIASPTDAHYDYICQALEAGKHVFTEKPLGHSLAQVKHCFDLAAENNLALHLGFQRRFDPNFIELKQQLSSLGDARIVKTSSRDNPRPSIAYLSISGNIFHDMLIHDFDMLCYLFGTDAPETVYTCGHTYDPEIAAIGDHDTVMVTLQYANGMMCCIDTSRISAPGYDQRIEVFGANGMAIAENLPEHHVKVYNHQGAHQAKAAHSFPERYKGVYQKELDYFGHGIANSIANNVSKEEAVLSHLIADAALLSAQQGRVVRFREEFGAQL